MFKPEYEVMYFGEDLVHTSEPCSPVSCSPVCAGECGVFTCNAQCYTFCKPECGTVYDTGKTTHSTKSAKPKNVIGFDMTFDK